MLDTLLICIAHRELLRELLQVPQEVVVDSVVVDVAAKSIQFQRLPFEDGLLTANSLALLVVTLEGAPALFLIELYFAVVAVDLVLLTIELLGGGVLVP